MLLAVVVALSPAARAADPTLVMPIRAEGMSAGEVTTIDTVFRVLYAQALGRPVWPMDTSLTGLAPSDGDMLAACRRVGCDKIVVLDAIRTGRVIVIHAEARESNGQANAVAQASAIDFNHVPAALASVSADLMSPVIARAASTSSGGLFIGMNSGRNDIALELGPSWFLDTGAVRTSFGAAIRVVSGRGELLPSFGAQGSVGWRESTGTTRFWAGGVLGLAIDRAGHATVVIGPELGITFLAEDTQHPFTRVRFGGAFDESGPGSFGSVHGGIAF